MADIMSQLVLQSTTAGAAKYQSWCCKVPKLVLQSTKVGAGKYRSSIFKRWQFCFCGDFDHCQDFERNGKSSPFNNMCSLNLIVMKANSREQMLWIVRCITDSLENDLTEHGVQDFTTRCLKGTSGSSGFIALSICKLEMLNHFLTNVGSKLARDEFRQMLGSMIDHPTFRSWCGSPKESADLSWQGQLLDSEVKAVNFFKCIFNGTLDSHLKTNPQREWTD